MQITVVPISPVFFSMSNRELSPEQAVSRFISKRRNENTRKTVRSYENRLRQFVRWSQKRDSISQMSDLDGWLIDEYQRFLQERGDAPSTVKGKMVALNELTKYCARIQVVDEELPDRVEIPTLSADEQTDDQVLDASDAGQLIKYYRNSKQDYGTVQHLLLEIIWHIGCRTGCIRSLDLQDWHPDEQKLTFRHRPPTRLKDGTKHERNVAVPDPIAEALQFYIARERFDKRDDNGREPLFTTRFGRPADATIQAWGYEATQPCLHSGCPHNNKRSKCKYTERNHASKCPSSRAPHAIRSGSITWQLDRGLSYVRVAKRVAASPETIRRYYDKADLDQELERRRSETENLDILNNDDRE